MTPLFAVFTTGLGHAVVLNRQYITDAILFQPPNAAPALTVTLAGGVESDNTIHLEPSQWGQLVEWLQEARQ